MLIFNGEFRPLGEPTLALGDHGVLYGYGLYETVKMINGHAIWLEEHLARLFASADFFSLHLPRDVATWRTWAGELCRRNDLSTGEAALRITVTRGVEEKGHFNHPCYWMTARPLPAYVAERRRGITATVLPPKYRRAFPEHKTLNAMSGALGLEMARSQGVQEGIFTAPDGTMLEGTISNIFAISGDEVITPSVHAGILPGVTRQWVLDACGAHGVRVEQAPLHFEMLVGAQAAFCSSTLVGLAPLVSVDGRELPDAAEHALFRALLSDYLRAIGLGPD